MNQAQSDFFRYSIISFANRICLTLKLTYEKENGRNRYAPTQYFQTAHKDTP